MRLGLRLTAIPASARITEVFIAGNQVAHRAGSHKTSESCRAGERSCTEFYEYAKHGTADDPDAPSARSPESEIKEAENHLQLLVDDDYFSLFLTLRFAKAEKLKAVSGVAPLTLDQTTPSTSALQTILATTTFCD